MTAVFNEVLLRLLDECRRHYWSRLVSLAVFGSVGRGTTRPDSDIDILLVVERRVVRGNAWFWELKPDYAPGEEFSL